MSQNVSSRRFKGDSKPNNKYVFSERALRTMNLIQKSSKSVEKWESYEH